MAVVVAEIMPMEEAVDEGMEIEEEDAGKLLLDGELRYVDGLHLRNYSRLCCKRRRRALNLNWSGHDCCDFLS